MRSLQSRRQRINFTLKFRDAAIRLLLTFPRGRGDNTRAPGFGASLAGSIWTRWIHITPDFELATGLAGAGPFDVQVRLFRIAGSAGLA
jgi:hypothetical protein